VNREDIIRMAREAEKLWVQHGDEFDSNRFLEIFAALVAAHEREVWAKYLDDCGEHEHANYIRSRGEVQS
jgi:hypothetical protein